MPDIVFKCDHCHAKLMGSPKRAGQDIVCPNCRKKTHVPDLQDIAHIQAAAQEAHDPDHPHYQSTHYTILPKHIPRSVTTPTRTFVLSGIGAVALFVLIGYLSFNPNPFNPGRTPIKIHHVVTNIEGDAPSPVEGKDWTSPATGMVFVWIPELKVWVGKYEVTNDEYLDKNNAHLSWSYGEISLSNDRQPVVFVSHENALDYARWLTRLEQSVLDGFHYRLPHVGEWITFAQCGRGWTYPWGNDWPPVSGRAGNYHGEEGAGSWEKLIGYNDGFGASCDVEKSWANPWNLCGVGGNVWEVCASDTNENTFGAWLGGSWNNCIPERLHCTNRIDQVGEPSLNMGFRLVMSR